MFLKQVRTNSPFRQPQMEPEVDGVISHSMGTTMYIVLVLAYTAQALVVWATAPIVETYSAHDVRNFGPMDIQFNISCPSCVPFEEANRTQGTELFQVWHGYDAAEYPHCAAAGAPQDLGVAENATAKLCYSSDDISERSGIVVYLWNMTSGGAFNRANILATAPGLRVNTPMEFWHEKTLLIGMTVVRDQEDCTSSSQCNLRQELYLTSMQYDGRVSGFPGSQLNVRLMRTAHVYTRAPSQTIWGVLGEIGGASGLILSMLAILVHYGEVFERRCHRKPKAETEGEGCESRESRERQELHEKHDVWDETIPPDVAL